MKLDKLWDGLKRIANGDYVLGCDLICEEDLVIDLDDRLVVKGSIEAKKSIKSGLGIEAGEGIKAGDGIESGEGIKAGLGIEAGEGIKAGWGIEAGDGIESGEGIKAGEGIEAGLGIKAGLGIEAGEGIEAKTYIHSEKRIFAGISVYHNNNNCKKQIKCAELRKGEICYGDLIIEKPVVKMTIAEIEQKLGIENLEIVEG